MEEVKIYGPNRINQDLPGICRLCLGSCHGEDQRWGLFGSDLPQKLMAFTTVQIQENDGLPGAVCTNCRNLVYMSYDFKCQVEKSDQELRHILLMRHSTNHWPEVAIVKSIESINAIESIGPCIQKHMINSCMTIQNEQSSTNNHEQFIFEITNNCNVDNQPYKKDESLQLSNNANESNIITTNTHAVSSAMDNILSENHRNEEVNLNFEAHYEMKNEENNKNDVIKIESSATKENTNINNRNTNQSDDEKPLILRTKRHKCKYCIKSFANLTLLEKHAVIHKKPSENTYNCYLCEQQFSSVYKVQNHLLLTHHVDISKDKITDFPKLEKINSSKKCCNDKISNESNSSTENGEDKNRKFTCKFCSRQFSYYKSFMAHIKTHSDYNDKLENLESDSQGNSNNIDDFTDQNSIDRSEDDECDFDFNDDDDDDDDDDNMLSSNIQCNQCGKLVATMRNLKRHLLTHSGLKYNCTICGKDFSRPDKLREHQQVKHKEELIGKSDSDDESIDDNLPTSRKKDKNNRPHKCSLCPKAFAQPQSLANHEERHKRVRDVHKRYLCEVCSKCFAQSGSLVAHMRTHTGIKPYVCNVCSRAFTKSTYLQLHLRTHSGEKPYICQYCSRAFARANTLARHITMHTGEAKYQCQICSKSFRRLTSLNEHTYTHTGQRPYACKICSKRYNNAGSLYAHTKKCKVMQANVDSVPPSIQQSGNGILTQSNTDTAPQILIFTEKKLEETITDQTITDEPACQFMIANVHDQKPMSTNMLEPFTIQEPHVYDLNSKQFKTPYYGLYPSM